MIMSFLMRAFSEMMRYSPPVPGQLRYSINEVTFSGITIPSNQAVYIQLASANSDETTFSDPRSYNIEREDLHLSKERKMGHHGDEGRYGHLGFGFRCHFCLGYEMARLEAVMGSTLLCEKMKNPRLVDGASTASYYENGTRSPVEVLIEYDQA